MTGSTQESSSLSSRLDTSVAHSARRYDYWLGGKDNFAADRESGDAIAAAFPTIRLAVRENRAFLRRAVAVLAEEAGIRQFLDIGTGLPTANNTHQVAQAIAPQSRIVYVDNDPLVLVHARALLTSAAEGATAYIDADLREPAKILNDPELHRTLDFSQPVALMLVAVMHFILDEDDPYGIVRRLVEALPRGSYLVVAQATYDPLPPDTVAALEAANARGNPKSRPRSRAEFARFFEGLDILPPGIVSVAEWRADNESQPRPSFVDISGYAAVAQIP
ncbi:SAM-dependent methyltransferase [Dactylosporangium darangshiense]|uniref:SAM-dependent methyltransferase n=1 Tax=Dactylosporangium darangshiense TaxID=579108 RepID=A0ABP8DQ22_9ACTN